jgi:hypothetical protein
LFAVLYNFICCFIQFHVVQKINLSYPAAYINRNCEGIPNIFQVTDPGELDHFPEEGKKNWSVIILEDKTSHYPTQVRGLFMANGKRHS